MKRFLLLCLTLLLCASCAQNHILGKSAALRLIDEDGNALLANEYEKVGDSAFEGSETLKTFEASKNVSEIGKRAFYGASALNTVVLHGSVTIGEEAFAQCGALSELWIEGNVSYCAQNAFDGHGALIIYGKSGSTLESVARANDISFYPTSD